MDASVRRLATRGEARRVLCPWRQYANSDSSACLRFVLLARRAFFVRSLAGLGAKQAEQFYQDGWAREPSEIFTLRARFGDGLQQLKNRDGWGEKSADKLFQAIEERRQIALGRFLFALGIRHVGEAASNLLAAHYGTWEMLRQGIDQGSSKILGLPAQHKNIWVLLQCEDEFIHGGNACLGSTSLL